MTPEGTKLQASYLPQSFRRARWFQSADRGRISTVLPVHSEISRYTRMMLGTGDGPHAVDEATRPTWMKPDQMPHYQVCSLGEAPVYIHEDGEGHTTRYIMTAADADKYRFSTAPSRQLGALPADAMRTAIALINSAPVIFGDRGKQTVTFTIPRGFMLPLIDASNKRESGKNFHLYWNLSALPAECLGHSEQNAISLHNHAHLDAANRYEIAVAPQRDRWQPHHPITRESQVQNVTVTMPIQATEAIFGKLFRTELSGARQTQLGF